MKYSIIVTQQFEKIVTNAYSEGMGERIQKSAMASIFPAGSDWGSYIGARSFRFIPIAYNNYLLSYSLILSEEQGSWDGQLHAWGLVGPLATFLTDSSLGSYNPHMLFMKNSSLFEQDDYFNAMVAGLEPVTTPIKWKLPLFVRYFIKRHKTAFSWKYTNPKEWASLESWLFEIFYKSLNKRKLLRRKIRPKTFSTFSLSTSEPTEVIGLPNPDLLTPVFGPVEEW